jgi:hypothetical protein
MEEIDPKLKKWGIALGVLLLSLSLIDLVVLKGEHVASGSASLRADSEPLVITISRPRVEHLVGISTRERIRGESRGQSIAYRLVTPDGMTASEDAELISRKKRYFDFVPMQAGDYQLHLQEATLIGSGSGTAYVNVTVGDRRVLSRLLGF